MTKSFTTQARKMDWIEFELDGKPLKMRTPKADVLAIAAAGEGADAIRDSVDAMFELFDEETAAYLRGRLLDLADGMSLDTIQEIIMWAIEEEAGRPTGPSSDSVPSRSNAGPRSGRTSRGRA